VGAGIVGIPGLASAKGHGGGQPCFKDFECEDDDSTYVKIEFVEVYEENEDGEEILVDCYFEEETDTGFITIDSYTSKEGECEPISVEWSVADGYLATKVMAYGGRDCVTVKDLLSTGGTFEPGLDGAGGQTAAISNLQFCVEEEECIDILADLQAGDEITGSTFGNVTITSSVAGNTILAAEEGKDPGFYGAPNGDGSLTNGCMGETIDIGFGDINAKEAKAPQNLDFTFDNPVSEFELRMLDFGDFNPTGASKHLIEITAFNSGGMVVDSETIEYYTDGSVNPTKGYETSALSTVVYENLNVEGDACGAEEGDIGDYTFLLTGDIAKVELRFPSGHDPNIAFDLPCTSQ
jgi:hypothetical protein